MISTAHRTCPQVTVRKDLSKVSRYWLDGLIGSLYCHGHVSVPSPGANGEKCFIILISYYLTVSDQLNIWTTGFIVSPYLSPFAFGFLVARIKSVLPFPGRVVLTIVHMSVGDGHMVLAPCMAYWFSSSSSSLDVRRKLLRLQHGTRSRPLVECMIGT